MIEAGVTGRCASLLPTVERTNLIAEFRSGNPLLVKLIAPAGYGKSTLAAAIAAESGSMARCDCLHMATPVDLLRCVLEAIGDAAAATDRLGISDAFISLGENEEEWLRYARRVFKRSGMPATIVFDNGEALADKPAVRRTFERILQDLPAESRIVFCSRVDVSLNFARFAGPDRTMRIGPESLRFDRPEIARLLARIGAKPSVVARVDAFTRGWPMLVMMLFVLAKRGRLDAYLSGRRMDATDLYGYLASEVLATLEPWARDLLEVVVALPDARLEDIEALHGAEGGSRLTELELATPFITRTPRGSLEVHPAIAEIVRTASKRGLELARTVVDELAASQPVRAARIAAHLGEYDRAAQLLEGARYVLSMPSLDLVETLYALPPEALIDYPAVWNVASYARIFSRDAAEWLNEADRVLARITADTPVDVQLELFFGFMNIYTQRGEFAKARSFSAAFAQTPAGMHPGAAVMIRFWECAEDAFLGRYVDREQWQRELAPLMRVKSLEILCDFDAYARHERLAGDAAAERAIVGRALEEARASGQVVLGYLTLTEALFGAWFWGDDDRFELYVRELEETVHPATERATGLLLAACHGRTATATLGTEQLKVRAYAYLIGAAKERTSERRRKFLHEAVFNADKCAQPFTAAIARVALGVADPERAATAFAEARALAAATWSKTFQEAVDAVGNGRSTGHMLAAFAQRFRAPVAQIALARKRLRIDIIGGSVEIDGRPIALSGREYELLAFLATHDGPASAEFVSESLWPESDADRARTTLKVTLSRLRNRLGDPSIVASTQHGYALRATCEIDLNEFSAASVGTSASDGTPRRDLPTHLQCNAARERIAHWAWAGDLEARLDKLERAIGEK